MKRRERTAVLALAAFAALACNSGGRGAKGAQDAGPLVVGPENTARVKRESIQAGPRLSGSLEPREQARIRAEVGGAITGVKVDLGQQVKKGQLLARIEDQALRNAHRSAQSAVRSAEVELQNAVRHEKRTQKLVKGGAMAEAELEDAQGARSGAESRLAQARAQLAQAAQQLDAATVTSSIDGVVSERAVNEGDTVAPGAPLFTVIDPSSMRLQASVPSEALGSLEVGTPVDFQVRGYGEQAFSGKIEQLAPAADPVTRQLTVLVSIPNPGGKLIAGLFAEGRIAAQSREALVVPEAALDRSGARPQVTVVKDGRAKKVPVTLGLRDAQTERVEVKGELADGELLLVGAAMSVPDGAQVQYAGDAGHRGK